MKIKLQFQDGSCKWVARRYTHELDYEKVWPFVDTEQEAHNFSTDFQEARIIGYGLMKGFYAESFTLV